MRELTNILAQGRRLYLHYLDTGHGNVARDISLYFIQPLESLKAELDAAENSAAQAAYRKATDPRNPEK